MVLILIDKYMNFHFQFSGLLFLPSLLIDNINGRGTSYYGKNKKYAK